MHLHGAWIGYFKSYIHILFIHSCILKYNNILVHWYICIFVYLYICIFVYLYICIFVYLYLPSLMSGNMISISSFFAPFFALLRTGPSFIALPWRKKSPSSFSTWSSSISRRRTSSSSRFLSGRIHHA